MTEFVKRDALLRRMALKRFGKLLKLWTICMNAMSFIEVRSKSYEAIKLTVVEERSDMGDRSEA